MNKILKLNELSVNQVSADRSSLSALMRKSASFAQ